MRFLRRGGAEPPPHDLLEDLRLAYDARDEKRLIALCAENESEIIAAFPAWTQPGEALLADAAALDRHFHTIGTVASVFARQLGQPELLARIVGSGDNNPILDSQAQLREADGLIATGRFEEVAARMEVLLTELKSVQGNAVPELVAFALGRLGQARFQAGSPKAAIEPLSQAAAVCTAEHDTQGVKVYSQSLFECYRYLGDAAEAATWLERLLPAAETLDDPELGWHRRELEIVRAGEPLNRIIGFVGERRCELADVPAAVRAGREKRVSIRFVNMRNRPGIGAAERRTDEAMQRASDGRPDEALPMFAAASTIDPHDPAPHYNAGVALLELARYDQARAEFERTETLAPGWFQCRRYAWLARGVAAGRIDPRVVPVLVRTADDRGSPSSRRRLLEPAVAAVPELGWLRLNLAAAFLAEGRGAEAETELRRGLAGSVDDDVRSSILVQLALAAGWESEPGRRMAEEALALTGNIAAQASAIVGLASR